MDISTRKTQKKSKSSIKRNAPLRYFFLNGALHKKIAINRGKDQITAWNYPEHKVMTYVYSDLLKRKEPVFTTAQVTEMINRSRIRIRMAIYEGGIEPPFKLYPINGTESGKTQKWMWSQDDILALHEYFSERHRGRPRKDGRIQPQALPSRRELLAMMRNENIMYIKDEDGEFRPVWAAKDFD